MGLYGKKGFKMITTIKLKNTKKPTYKDLALYLGVSEQAVKQYPKNKRHLMVLGLWLENEYIATQTVF